MDDIPAKTIVTRNQSTAWFGCRYNMNIYRGCCHGCIYCDSRSDCYRIEDFDQVRAKADALRIIRDDLRRKVIHGIIGTGAMSDPYNPVERQRELTRHGLELVSAYGFGIAIATKSDLVVRDLDILQEIKKQAPAFVMMTVTALDDSLCAKLEPGVCRTSARFDALSRLSGGGVMTGILLMPVLPFLEDTEENVLGIVRRAAQCGVKFIYPAFGMTLRDGQRRYFYDRLDDLFPGVRERYEKRYGARYRCASPVAGVLYQKFAAACDRAGIVYRMRDIIALTQVGYGDGQLTLFDQN